MSDENTTLAGDDVNAYSRDKVSVLLKLTTWYVRLRRSDELVERPLGMAVDLVENHRGMHDAQLNRLLDDYADTFRWLKRPVIAGQLADLAQRVRDNFPGEFTPEGDDVPWWLQEKFIRSAPPLPVEFRSSHAAEANEWGVAWVAAVTFAVTLPIAMTMSISIEAMSGTMFLLAITIVPIVVGIILSRSHKRALLRIGDESWVRVTADGVRYHDPRKDCDFRWEEIRHVWTSWESGAGEEVIYHTVVVVGPTITSR